MEDIPKFETWDRQQCVNMLYAWYHLLRLQQDSIEQMRWDLKDAAKANRELLVKLKGQDDDWK